MFNKEYFNDNEWYDIHGKKTIGIKRFLKCINVDKFKTMLINDYNRDKDSSYSEITYNACRIGVAFILSELSKKNKSLAHEISIATGLVNNTWHCWIATYDYYIDLTAQQFNSDYPELLIVKRTKSEKENILVPMKIYTYREWIEHEEAN